MSTQESRPDIEQCCWTVMVQCDVARRYVQEREGTWIVAQKKKEKHLLKVEH